MSLIMRMLSDDEDISDQPLPTHGAGFLWCEGICKVGEARAVLLYAEPRLFVVAPNFGKTSLREMRDVLFAGIKEDEWSADQERRGEICAYHVFNALTMKAVERKWKAGNTIEAISAALQTHSASVIAGLRRGGWISPESGHDISARITEYLRGYSYSKGHWRKTLTTDRRELLKRAFA